MCLFFNKKCYEELEIFGTQNIFETRFYIENRVPGVWYFAEKFWTILTHIFVVKTKRFGASYMINNVLEITYVQFLVQNIECV